VPIAGLVLPVGALASVALVLVPDLPDVAVVPLAGKAAVVVIDDDGGALVTGTIAPLLALELLPLVLPVYVHDLVSDCASVGVGQLFSSVQVLVCVPVLGHEDGDHAVQSQELSQFPGVHVLDRAGRSVGVGQLLSSEHVLVWFPDAGHTAGAQEVQSQELSQFPGVHTCDSSGWLVGVAQLFVSVHVLVCVPVLGQVVGDQSVQSQ